MIPLHLDLETRSDINLKTAGVYTYSRGKKTDILCACYAFGDEQPHLWLPGNEVPKRVVDHIEAGGELHAHNATFEQELINNVGTRLYGWPHLYSSQLVCTMAQAYALGLPGSLAGAAAALGIDQQKDQRGYRLMLQYCVPREITPDGKIIWWDDPDDLKRIWEYCRQDVIVEREIGKRMLRLSHYEQKVWELDQQINSRGIKIDIPAVKAATLIVGQEQRRLINEIQAASDNTVATPGSVQQIKNFLALYGFDDVESIAKAEAAELRSRPNLPDACRRVLDIRAEASKTSTAKLEAMLTASSPWDNRFRGGFQYSGANTRRFAARKIQLHNLPRYDNHALINDMLTEISSPKGLTADQIRLHYGKPLDMISSALRGFLVAEDSKEFLACDFSAIEARVIAWLAGQESVLEIFRTHGKVYEHAAASIFAKAMSEILSHERQIGKVAILALGYQGGVGALQQMAKGYNCKLETAYRALWSRATIEEKEWVERKWEQDKKEYQDISREEYVASDLTKTFWRKANPKIVEFWSQLEGAAIEAVNKPGIKHFAKGIQFLKKGSFLFCRLQSGGVISYPYPEVKTIKTKWGQNKWTLTYMSEDQNHKWVRFPTYGGSIAENVTQSLARDLLVDAMLRLETFEYQTVLHVHDEIVCEHEIGKKSLSEMQKIMCDVPVWAEGLPIAAGGWVGRRYHK